MAAARQSGTATEAKLTAVNREMSGLAKDAARLPVLEQQAAALRDELAGAQKQLAQGQQTAERLQGELSLEGRRLEQLEKSAADLATAGEAAGKVAGNRAARVAELEKANKALAAELETLKGELLAAAVRGAEAAKPVPEAVVAAPARWAMRVPYETARSFLALHSDAGTVSSATTAEGLVSSTGVVVANAVQMRMVHDRAKERVFSVTIAASLGGDVPKETTAANRELVGLYLRTFVPGLKDMDVAGVLGQLAGADESRRLVYLGEESMVTVWNRKGTYTFRVESVRGELE